MSELANAEIVNLFAGPFLSYRWPDSDELNKELRQRVLAHERENPARSQSKSNVGGWHSETGRLEFRAASGKAVLRRATELVNEATRQVPAGRQVPPFSWRLEAWAKVNRPGDFNRSHVHGMSTCSGTYYVDPGEPEEAESGFPHRGKRPRISIAFNFRKEPFP